MRILVIGGNGFFGRAVTRALRQVEAFSVQVARRAPVAEGEVALDLTRAETWAAADDFDLIVNCSDALNAPPRDFALTRLARGQRFVETSDDAATLRRLWLLEPGPGTLICGLGIMPGLSNLVAAEAMRQAPEPVRRLEVALRFNPLSGAGAGMNALSAELLTRRALRYEGGEPIAEPAVLAGVWASFVSGWWPTLRFGLPEAWMLHESTGALSTAGYLSFSNPALELGLFGTSLALQGVPILADDALATLRAAFNSVRSNALILRPTPFEIMAIADRAAARTVRFATDDGIRAGALAIAAGLTLLAADWPAPGVYLPDQVLRLKELVAEMRTLDPGLLLTVADPVAVHT